LGPYLKNQEISHTLISAVVVFAAATATEDLPRLAAPTLEWKLKLDENISEEIGSKGPGSLTFKSGITGCLENGSMKLPRQWHPWGDYEPSRRNDESA
jgi:hypothetical protein